MLDNCVQAIEWTVNGRRIRIYKSANLTPNEDNIFILGKCFAQEVTLTYIFSDNSNFQIDDSTLKLTVQPFTERCLPIAGEGQEGLKG